MTARNYTNTASQAATTAFIDATATSIALTGYTGFPAAPFTAALARGTAEEEVVLVTSVSGSTVTVTRGFDATNPVSHSAATTFQHVVVAKDYADSAAHQAATTAHGVTGQLVGTTDVQTLTNKTLTSPTLAGAALTGAATGESLALTGTLSAAATTLASLTVTGAGTVGGLLTASGGITVPTGKTVLIADAPALGTAAANKAYTDAQRDAAKTYADGLDAARKTYVDTAGATLTTYIDTQDAAYGRHLGNGTAYPASPHEGDTYRRTDLGYTARWDGTTWTPQGAMAVFGKAWRTSGAGPAGGTTSGPYQVIPLDTSRVTGGVTFGSNKLTLPLDGHWEISVRSYVTGSVTGNTLTTVIRSRASVADATAVTAQDVKLSSGIDWQSHAIATVPLKAGDTLSAQFSTGSLSGPIFYYGLNETSGVMISARWVGPLNGATPL